MSDFFTPVPDATPYTSLDVPVQTGSIEGRRVAQLLTRTDQSEPDADSDRTARIVELSREADALAAHRSRYGRVAYARLQGMLFAEAEATIR
jgi:hypothetical protein